MSRKGRVRRVPSTSSRTVPARSTTKTWWMSRGGATTYTGRLKSPIWASAGAASAGAGASARRPTTTAPASSARIRGALRTGGTLAETTCAARDPVARRGGR